MPLEYFFSNFMAHLIDFPEMCLMARIIFPHIRVDDHSPLHRFLFEQPFKGFTECEEK